jgi:hypothetical protein
MVAKQYALPKSRSDDPRNLEAYIRESAKKHGIDPDIAMKVARSEGLSNFQSGVFKNGKQEPSYGAFQLYTGGGLGNKFQKETGLDPSDPKNERATIDYALGEAAKSGWGQWYGAAKVGVGNWDGISNSGADVKTADAASGYGGSDSAASERASRITQTTGSTDIPPTAATTAPQGPAGDFLDKLKNSQTAQTGLGEAVTGLGEAATGSSPAMAKITAPPVAVAQPMVMPTPQIMPAVNPNVVNAQKQQLAAAMQRLNTGRLY